MLHRLFSPVPPWAGLEIPPNITLQCQDFVFLCCFIFLFFSPIYYLAANLLFFIIHISVGWLLGRKLRIITALAARAPKSDWDIEPCKLYSHLETKRMFSLKRHTPASPQPWWKVEELICSADGDGLIQEESERRGLWWEVGGWGVGGGKVTFRNTLMLQHSDHFRPHMSFQSGISGKFNLLTKFE